MKIGILVGLVALLLLMGVGMGSCATSKLMATPTATLAAGTPQMGAGEAAVALLQQDMELKLTQQYIDGQRLEQAAKMTATQQVIDAQVTAEARRMNMAATQAAATATHQVWEVTAQAAMAQSTSTAVAQATATAQAMINAQASAEAQATQVEATAVARATATADSKTQEAPVVFAQRTAVAAQAQSAQLAAERERMTNLVIAWGPILAVAIGIAVISFVTVRKSGIGTIERDANGMMPGVVVFHDGRREIISPDRMFGPVITASADGVSAPLLVDAEKQEATTRRAQAVEAINALPQQQQRQGMSMMSTFNPTVRPSIQVMEGGQARGWIDEAESKLGEEM